MFPLSTTNLARGTQTHGGSDEVTTATIQTHSQ